MKSDILHCFVKINGVVSVSAEAVGDLVSLFEGVNRYTRDKPSKIHSTPPGGQQVSRLSLVNEKGPCDLSRKFYR